MVLVDANTGIRLNNVHTTPRVIPSGQKLSYWNLLIDCRPIEDVGPGYSLQYNTATVTIEPTQNVGMYWLKVEAETIEDFNFGRDTGLEILGVVVTSIPVINEVS